MGLLKYIAGADARRSLRKINAIADKIDALSPQYEKLTDDELKAMTIKLKERLKNGETLDNILVDAFATVREASMRVLHMKHYKVQLMGGVCLFQGRVAEMKTGEGKTLMATLAAYLSALSEKGVHIVTVNDYLAKRDAEWMGKIYRFLGLKVGVIIHGMSDDEKREAYKADITYATNNELGFDYLRDNLKVSLKDMVLRGLDFAIVDEVDSILIDEARTPLIISGAGEKSSELYTQCNRFVKTLTPEEDFLFDLKEKTVTITESGSAKAERFFGIENLGDISNAELNQHIQQALKAHTIFKRDNDYIVQDGEVIIVDEFTGRLMLGRRYSDGLHQAIEAKEGVVIRNENKTHATITFQNFFRLYRKLSGMTGTAKTEEEEFRAIYGLDVLEIPTNKPMIRVDYNDAIYSTEKGKFRAIVNEIDRVHATGQPILVGTVTVERSEEVSKMLLARKIKHNVLNAKNHKKEAEIIAQAGKLGTVTIATNMAGRGTDILLGGNPEFLAKQAMRNKGVEEEIIELATSFIEGISDEVKAVRDEYNAIYSEFKKQTDAEKEQVLKLGGLYILGTERHESRRIDNQLRGRGGRQGDPGYSRFYISLEDELAKRFGGERMQSIYRTFKVDEDTPLEAKMLSRGIENAQRNIEGRNFGIRKNILQYDDVMNRQRMVMYEERLKVLRGESVHDNILHLIPDYAAETLTLAIGSNGEKKEWNEESANKIIENKLLPIGSDFLSDELIEKKDYNEILALLTEKTVEEYEKKLERYKDGGEIDFGEVEKLIYLKTIDKKWIDHIDAMDQLRKSIGLRAYANMDPVIAYKQEGVEMFEGMTDSINEETISLLLKVEVHRRVEVRENKNLQENNPTGGAPAPIKAAKTIGRNDPCPCGSGKKYKNCCGKNS